MLQFASASTRSVSPVRAIDEVIETACGTSASSTSLVLVNAGDGHDLGALSARVREHCPVARILATSCAGIVGREGPGESLREVAILCISGQGFRVASVEGIYGANSHDCGVALGQQLQDSPHPVKMVFLIASGIDIANDALIAGIESVLGPEVTIFGGTSSDQMQGIATHQAIDGRVCQHAAYAVGFWAPGLEVDTQATHGFAAVGEPLVVTAAQGNRILELDDKPAWPRYLERLGLPADARLADTIPVGALAEELPAALAAEYGNPHILRVVTQHTPDGSLVYSTDCPTGTRLWLTMRDELRIFGDMDRMMSAMVQRNPGRKPIAVFQADCLARGRRLFDRVMKDELVQRIQQPLAGPEGVPPWFGMYGFGEYARLGGGNTYHNYTTALAALYTH